MLTVGERFMITHRAALCVSRLSRTGDLIGRSVRVDDLSGVGRLGGEPSGCLSPLALASSRMGYSLRS